MTPKSNKVSSPSPKSKKNGVRVRPQNVGLSDNRMVLAPVAKAVLTRMGQPKFSGAMNGGAVRVTHREYVADINGTAAFSSTTGSINPGLSGLFPWLSQFGLAYESYQFNKLRFVLEPIASTASAGQMYMAVDYDAADSAPSSKIEVLQYKGAVAGPLWNQQVMPVTGKDEQALSRRRYVRSGTLASNLDIKTYDIGNLFVCSSGAASTIAASALFVEYDISFFTPQYSLSAFAAAYSRKISATTGVTSSSLYGTAATLDGGLDVTASGNTLTFNKPGQYYLENTIVGTGIAADEAPTTSGTATATLVRPTTVNGTTAGVNGWVITALEKGATFVSDYSGVFTTVSEIATRIAPYLVSLA